MNYFTHLGTQLWEKDWQIHERPRIHGYQSSSMSSLLQEWANEYLESTRLLWGHSYIVAPCC